jgi:G:T-mismatch repair DNA endonuclease (very short patch repair protein)
MSAEKRSKVMSKIKGKNTKPEKVIFTKLEDMDAFFKTCEISTRVA